MVSVASSFFVCVVYLWETASFPWLARRRRALAYVLAAVVTVHFIAGRIAAYRHSGSVVQTLTDVPVVVLVIAAVPIGVIRALSWAVARRARRRPRDAADGEMTRRQIIEATSGAAFLGATGSMIGWGIVRGRHAFELREVAVRIAGLPRVLDGYVIAQISDLHTGMHVGEREVDEGLSRVREARPDLVVVTGDILDIDPSFAPMIARRLADLAPRDGVAAVLGNHDYYTGASQVLATLRAAGVDGLVDEGRVIRPGDGAGFALLGVDDLMSIRYGRVGPRLPLALGMVPPDLPRILLSHQPPSVDRWAGQVALQLSGHTHGGQINVGIAGVVFRYLAGLYRVGGTTLYVNRGFGTVGPPARIGAPPEVTRIVLVAG